MNAHITEVDQQAEQLEDKRHAPLGRRSWLPMGGLAVLLLMAAGAIGWWIGSSTDTTGAPAIVDEWEDAWISGDPEAVASLYAEEATWSDPTDPGAVLVGKDAIRDNAEFTFTWIDLSEFEHETVIVGNGLIVVEAEWKGDSRAVGRSTMTPFSTQAVTVLEVEDGLITNTVLYFDPDELFT